jgi:flagellar assembly factor FliW
MKITTTRFGELEINPDAILTFPNGLPGLENCKRYQLLHEDLEGPVVFYLQSLDDPAVSFSIIDPAQFGFNYEIVLTDEEVELLQAGDPNELAVVLMVYKPLVPENQKIISHGGITANINGPLVLNPGKKLGMQKLLVGPRYDITLRGS